MYDFIKWTVIIVVIVWLGGLLLSAAGLPVPSYQCGESGGAKITSCKIVLR